MQIKNGLDRRDSQFHELTAAIQQKIDTAEASLLYDDKTRARELVAQSQNLLKLIDARYAHRKEYKDVLEKLSTIDTRINNIVRIQSPTVLAPLPTLASTASGILHLVHTDSEIFAYSQNSIYKLNEKERILQELPLHEKIPSVACGQIISGNKLLFCNSAGDRLYTLLFPEQTVASSTLALGEHESGDRILKSYNDRLYVLTLDQGLIFRHITTTTGFSKGSSWLKGKADGLARARDFTIDGTLYVLSNTGSLLLFSAGRPAQQRVPEQTNKHIATATRIWTNQGESRIYLLDPRNNQIIILDKKTLETIGRITSEDFQDIKDMIIYTKKKEIILLDKGRILKVPLSF